MDGDHARLTSDAMLWYAVKTKNSTGPGTDYFYFPHYQTHNRARLNHRAGWGCRFRIEKCLRLVVALAITRVFSSSMDVQWLPVGAPGSIQAVQARYPGVIAARAAPPSGRSENRYRQHGLRR